MKSSESNPPVKTKPREAEAGPEEEAFPEELMRLARPPKGITAEVKDGVLTIRRRWYVGLQADLIGGLMDDVIGLFNRIGLKDGQISLMDVLIGVVGLFSLVYLFGLFSVFYLGGPLRLAYLGGLVYLFVSIIPSIIRKPIALIASGDVLQVKYSPLGPSASREIRTDMIHQIFVVASPYWSGEFIGTAPRMSETFTVKARLHPEEHVVFFDGLTKPQAKFIEHRLEAFLGIANHPVEGEVED